MTRPALFTFGTRGSPLALAQANEARRRLAEAHNREIERIALQAIRTTGDRIQGRPLADVGGKGLFTKEIDAALLAGAIDAAVHSAKDLPSIMHDGVAIAAYLPCEDVRDALISALADTIEDLPHGATLGAASLRRQARRRSGFDQTSSPRSSAATSDKTRQGRGGCGWRHAARARRVEAAPASPTALARCSTSTSSYGRQAGARSRSRRAASTRARFRL